MPKRKKPIWNHPHCTAAGLHVDVAMTGAPCAPTTSNVLTNGAVIEMLRHLNMMHADSQVLSDWLGSCTGFSANDCKEGAATLMNMRDKLRKTKKVTEIALLEAELFVDWLHEYRMSHPSTVNSTLVPSAVPQISTPSPGAESTPLGQPVAASTPVGQPAAESSPTSQPLSASTPIGQSAAESSPTSQPLSVSTPIGQPAAESSPTSQPLSASTPIGQPVATSTPVGQPAAESSPTSQPVASTSTPVKKGNHLVYNINRKREALRKLDEQVSSVKENLKTLRQMEGHYSPRNVDKRDKRGVENFRRVMQLRPKLLNLEQENQKLKQDMVTMKRELDEKDRMIKTHHEKWLKELKLKRTYQKMASYHKNRRMDCDNCAKLQSKVKDLNQENLCLQMQSTSPETSVICTKENGAYSLNVRTCVLELLGLDIATAKVGPAIQSVAKHLFGTDLRPCEVPSREACRLIADEGHFLHKAYVGERLDMCKNFGLHKDGTSRRKRKILETSVALDGGEVYSLGFSSVASETSQAIAADASGKLEEVIDITLQSRDGTNEELLPRLLEKLSYYMSDRAANEKKSNELLDEWRSNVLHEAGLSQQQVPLVHSFFCMAHVLLGFHSYAVKELKELQHTINKGKIGRDLEAAFQNWNFEVAVARLCRTASETFGPAGNHLGVRDLWEAHCAEHAIKSKIINYKDNRFNAIFQVAHQVIHHKKDFITVLERIKKPNKLLQSLLSDLKDTHVISMTGALAVMYEKVTGPLWELISSNTLQYLELHKLIQPLYRLLKKADARLLLQTSAIYPVATTEIATAVQPSEINEEFFIACVEALIRGFTKAMEAQLADFLPEGKYSSECTQEELERTGFGQVTNLISEHHFGDLDSSQRRRPSASFHHHTTVHLLKKNKKKVSKWIGTMTSERRVQLWKKARQLSAGLRKKHQERERREMMTLSSTFLSKPESLHAKQSRSKSKPKRSDAAKALEGKLPSKDSCFNPGQWLAVAYQDGAYPGVVLTTESDEEIKIDFAHRCSAFGRFKWPDGTDTQLVSRKFILSANLQVSTQSSGRLMTVENWRDIADIFTAFHSLYFC